MSSTPPSLFKRCLEELLKQYDVRHVLKTPGKTTIKNWYFNGTQDGDNRWYGAFPSDQYPVLAGPGAQTTVRACCKTSAFPGHDVGTKPGCQFCPASQVDKVDMWQFLIHSTFDLALPGIRETVYYSVVNIPLCSYHCNTWCYQQVQKSVGEQDVTGITEVLEWNDRTLWTVGDILAPFHAIMDSVEEKMLACNIAMADQPSLPLELKRKIFALTLTPEELDFYEFTLNSQ